jgi:hypothetical protein
MSKSAAVIIINLLVGLAAFFPLVSQAGELAICIGGIEGRNLSCNRQDFIGKDIGLAERSLGEMSENTWRLVNVLALPPLLQKRDSPQESNRFVIYYFFERGYNDSV